ncbi:MAG: TIGR03936 family radical SAM-associated protein [Candidatus Nanopelagicales bacterium]|nr:TIGR03936 family radical SAM-associated protein [Candidatus Nanopelagicales bacterium]
MNGRNPGRVFEPPAETWRVRYAKRDRMRWASHRDFQRSLERGVRRAGIPMAFSAGFRPHPKISYAGAVPTGAGSEAEYLELSTAVRIRSAVITSDLDEALPAGFSIMEAFRSTGGSLAERLQASLWEVEVLGLPEEQLGEAVDAFLAAGELPVERITKSGRRIVDARQPVLRFDARFEPDSKPQCAILDLALTHATPSVRATDVLAALWRVSGIGPKRAPRLTRMAQGPLVAGTGSVGDPLAPDRAGFLTPLS